jgi:hypothetical protein
MSVRFIKSSAEEGACNAISLSHAIPDLGRRFKFLWDTEIGPGCFKSLFASGMAKIVFTGKACKILLDYDDGTKFEGSSDELHKWIASVPQSGTRRWEWL